MFGMSCHGEQLVAGQKGLSLCLVSCVVVIFFFLCSWRAGCLQYMSYESVIYVTFICN